MSQTAHRNLLVPEVAERLRRSVYTIRRWVAEGKLKPINHTGGKGSPMVFSETEIERFESNTRPLI